MTININDIKIYSNYLNTMPNTDKLNKCRSNLDNGIYDRKIVLNSLGYLIDGYILYCVLKERGYDGVVDVQIPAEFCPKKSRYIAAVHSTCPKEYYWKVPETIKDRSLIGKKALVKSKNHIEMVTVTQDFVSEFKPVKGQMKYIIKIVE